MCPNEYLLQTSSIELSDKSRVRVRVWIGLGSCDSDGKRFPSPLLNSPGDRLRALLLNLKTLVIPVRPPKEFDFTIKEALTISQRSELIKHQHMEQLRKRSYPFSGEVNFVQEEDTRLETTRARLSKVLRRHEELKERLSRDSDKMIFLRLQKEFEAARAAQTEEISLEGDQWNDGLLATIREKVHMEADRKATLSEASMPTDPHFQAKVTYRIGNKVICCLDGSRFGIQYETFFAGEPCEIYHCVLESKSFLEKMSVVEHTIPFFLPIREAENDLLSSDAKKFIDYIGEVLDCYVERREQVRLIKELYGNQIGDLYHSLAYNLIEFVLDDFECKVTVSLRYADLISVLPSRIRVLAWPVHPSKKISTIERKGFGTTPVQSVPSRLSYAEDALRTMSLPEAYAEIVLNLPQVLQKLFPHLGGL